MFIAAAAGTQPSAAALSGRYWIAGINFPVVNFAILDSSFARNALFALDADGAGKGSLPQQVVGYIAGTGSSLITEATDRISYSFTNGVGTLSFPATAGDSTLIAGNKAFYLSPDGSVLFGGSQMAGTSWSVSALPGRRR